jgi:response regulator RpfG family c-di-GMP phosphodiesterase
MNQRIFVVEDNVLTAAQLELYITEIGYQFIGSADNGETALIQIKQSRPDLVLMDIRLKGTMDGIEVATRLQAENKEAVIYLTAYADDELLTRAKLTEPFGYLVKPFSRQDLKASIEVALFKSQMEKKNERILDAVVYTISELVKMHAPCLNDMQNRSAVLAQALAVELALPMREVKAIRMAAQLQCIGLILIPGELLSRRMPISPTEYEKTVNSYIKKQPEIGYKLLKDIEFDSPVAEMVYQHMERLDGSGFPRGLIGDAILPGARVVAVACRVAKLLTPFGCDVACNTNEALDELDAANGTLFDSKVVTACLHLFRDKGFKFLELSETPA